MRVLPNLKKKMRAYSFWALLLSITLFLLPEFFFAYVGRELASPYLVGLVALYLGVFGLVGWGVDQRVPDLIRTTKLAILSAGISIVIMVLLTAPSYAMGKTPDPEPPAPSGVVTYEDTAKELVPLVKRWEGKSACKDNPELHCSYLDRIASPALWTVCYGHTKTAAKGQWFTEAHCEALLSKDLKVYWAGVRKGFTPETIASRLTPKRDAAFSDLGYNAGVGAVRSSTATRRLNAGDIAGSCEGLTWYNKSGGRLRKGLVNRRAEDYALCMWGLA